MGRVANPKLPYSLMEDTTSQRQEKLSRGTNDVNTPHRRALHISESLAERGRAPLSQNLKQNANLSSDTSDTDDNAERNNNVHDSSIIDAHRRRRQDAAFAEVVRKQNESRLQDRLQEVRGCMGNGQAPVEVFSKRKIIDSVRDYQSELFARASASNVIAVLDTGSGKTLIAALLVREILTKEMENRASGELPRTAFFLTNNVALAEQQHQMLRQNLAEVPRLVHGGIVKAWRQPEWSDLFSSHQIVVCTAEILYKCLNSGYIKIENINLIVFDEAHHAKKGHPYASIIKDHYSRVKFSLRPKIFGTTASPVDGKGDVLQASHMLESLLHAKIVTTKSLSLDTFTPKATVQEWEYTKLPPPFETALCQQMQFCRIIPDLASHFEEAKRVAAELGSWCSDQTWKYALEKGQSDRILCKYEGFGTARGGSQSAETLAILETLKRAEEVVMRHPVSEPKASDDLLSSKVLLLYHKISQHFTDNVSTRCLIFVERRSTARVLLDLFRALRVSYLRPGLFLGVGGSKSGQTGVTGLQTRELKANFESGFINCLFCTSVAEEGVDSPECNLVIRFDLYDTMIQYVQSRGRARAKSSVYGQMIERGNPLHRVKLEDVYYHETQLREFLANLDEDRFLESDYLGISGAFGKEAPNKTFATNAGSRCNYRTAIQCLEGFAKSLHHEGIGEDRVLYEAEIAEGMFKFRTILPEGSPVRGATGDSFPNKTSAKQSAAWETCFLLRAKGLLDNNLHSIFFKHRPANANRRSALSSSQKDDYPMLIKPEFWDLGCGRDPAVLYATIIHLIPAARLTRAHDPLLLLTRSPLPQVPEFPVYLDGNVETKVVFTQLSIPYPVGPTMLASLKQFTFQVFRDLFNKNYSAEDAQVSYWLAPTSWDLGQSAPSSLRELVDPDIEKNWEPLSWSRGSNPSSWCGQFLIDKWSGKYRYWTHETLKDLNIESAIPEGVAVRRSKGIVARKVMEYTLSLYGAHRARFLDDCDPSQPVLRAELVQLRRNFLDQHDQQEGGDSPAWYHICPEPLTVSKLPSGLISTTFVFPAIISRIDSCLIAAEACVKLGLEIRADLALEAITKNTDNTEEHRGQQIHLQRGMGKNYERLEFLGDSFLKMTTTIMLFILYPKSDEVGYHVKRMEMICNQNLFTVAVSPDISLPQYVRSKGFNRRYWYPEGMVLSSGKGAVRGDTKPFKHDIPKHGLGHKTVADVSEALMGASLLSPKGANEYDMAIRAVTKLVNCKDHDIQSWSDYSRLYEPPPWSTKTEEDGFTYGSNSTAARIQRRTGYTFRYPRLLRSAMTHPSSTHATVPDYQRLEFLGDALLDMVCIRHLYDRFPDRNPQWLTEHKMAMVSNKFLSALAVDLEFDTCLYYSGLHLGFQIRDYAPIIRSQLAIARNNTKKKKGKNEDGSKDIGINFWAEMDESAPPKCLSDSVESYIGAVFVDSGFDYAQVERFFHKHIYWYFSDMSVYDTFANKHPTTELHRLLVKQFKCHDYRLVSQNRNNGQDNPEADGDADGESTLWALMATKTTPEVTAGILIHDQLVQTVTRASTRYAKIAVSRATLVELQTLSREQYMLRFRCRCAGASSGGGRVDVPIGGVQGVSAL